jgi:hypothetical protein
MRNRELGLLPIGFLDDDHGKRGLRIDGCPGAGTPSGPPASSTNPNPVKSIIAILRARLHAGEDRASASRGIPVRTLPTLFELLQTPRRARLRRALRCASRTCSGVSPCRWSRSA